MRKAYNVYTIIEKTSMRAAFRKFTLLFAFGVCFLGFQTQGSSQVLSAVPANGAITGNNTDYNFLRAFEFTVSVDDAASVLRNQLKAVMDAPAITDAEDLNGLVRGKFLKAAIENLMGGSEIYTSLGRAYQVTAVEPFVLNNLTNIDLQGVVEGYARLLD